MFVSIANAKKEACFTEIHPTAYASLRGRGNSFCTLVKYDFSLLSVRCVCLQTHPCETKTTRYAGAE